MENTQYTEREIDRNIKTVERDIGRVEKEHEEFKDKHKALTEHLDRQKAYLIEQKQKLEYWKTENKRLAERHGLKIR